MIEGLDSRDPDEMEKMVRGLSRYWSTYGDQLGYRNYSRETLLQDALYGIGIALGKDKYRYIEGFKDFKTDLLAFLQEDLK
jgi:hypothetical protein